MIFQHIRTGDMYRTLFNAFDVERQKQVVIYMSLTKGGIFSRDEDKFNENFKFIGDAQSEIVPRDKNQTELSV